MRAKCRTAYSKCIHGCAIDKPLDVRDHSRSSRRRSALGNEAVFDNGIRKEVMPLRQPAVIVSFCDRVEAAARHVVESALSTAEQVSAMA